MTKIKLFLLLIIVSKICFAQDCETINLELFKELPKDFPRKANCIDKNGLKQGWWIYYQIDNETDFNGNKRSFVNYYYYGKYKDNKKTGFWLKQYVAYINRVTRTEYYNYEKDTIWDIVDFIDDKVKIIYNRDSTFINSMTIRNFKKDTFYISCNKNKYDIDSCCTLFYKNKLIKKFNINNFDFELNKTQGFYEKEKKIINYHYYFFDNFKSECWSLSNIDSDVELLTKDTLELKNNTPYKDVYVDNDSIRFIFKNKPIQLNNVMKDYNGFYYIDCKYSFDKDTKILKITFNERTPIIYSYKMICPNFFKFIFIKQKQ